ncbi:MAG: preprotein translocase subunit SecE [Clostridiales bacterium]|jgi:preprotein translocase subunit SecE|nr:preprotein translocase subunit SecE [Clostridiales bacterium]
MADEKIEAIKSEKSESAKPDKSGKPAKNKKEPRFRPAVIKFFRDFKGEFKKISWPTRQTVFRNTLATLAMCAVIGLFVILFDLGLTGLIQLMMSL